VRPGQRVRKVVGESRGQFQGGQPRALTETVKLDLTALFEVRIEGDPTDRSAASGEVRGDAL
jgi:hypothetical protein